MMHGLILLLIALMSADGQTRPLASSYRSYDENDFWHEYDQEQAPSLHRGMEGWHGLNDSISL